MPENGGEPLDERRLQTFLTAARLGSFSRAAEVLFVTQSTVTARIAELERELERDLFIREGRGVRLTDVGRAFIPYAQRCMECFEEARAALTEANVEGRVRLMACHVPAAYDLPEILRQTGFLHGDHVEVHIRTGPSKRIFREMLQGEIDVGLVNVRFQHPEVLTETLAERPVALVSQETFLSKRLPEFKGPIFFFEEELEDALLVRSICHRLGWPPERVIGLNDMTALKNLLRNGSSVGLLPREAVEEEIRRGTLRDVTGELGATLPPQITCLLVRRGHGAKGANRERLLEGIRRYYRSRAQASEQPTYGSEEGREGTSRDANSAATSSVVNPDTRNKTNQ